MTKRFTPCRVFSSAVIIPYLERIVKSLLSTLKNCIAEVKEEGVFKNSIFFSKNVWTLPRLCDIVLCYRRYNTMNIIKELWHGNIIPQDDSRNNSPEMKQLMEYMSRHHDDLLKSMKDEQKEIFEKFDDCWGEYMSLAEAAIFEYAFKLGMQIAIEALTE